MLDQSFSAENFRNIFQIENRKGNLKKDRFPDEYINLIMQIKLIKKDIKDKLQEYKEGKTDKDTYIQFRGGKNEEIKKLNTKKEEVLFKYLKDISEKINDSEFKFEIRVDNEHYDKPVYQLPRTDEIFYAMKQLQYNVRKTFKVKQANRFQILKQIKVLLNDDFPKYIIRTDIKEFYESVPQAKILAKIEDNTLLNYQSKDFIKKILDEFENKKESGENGKGLPRGIGISAYLAELYMREIDTKIKSFQGVTYYARYVDDIFIVFTPNTKIADGGADFLKQIETTINAADLSLKEEKTKVINLQSKSKDFKDDFTYLGYKFSINSVLVGEKGQKKNEYRTIINLSDNKIEKYKERMKHVFLIYNQESKYNERQARKNFFNSLRFLTGNFALINSKKGIKTGIYYSNNLLEVGNLKDLAQLQGCLKKLIHTELKPYEKLIFDREKFIKQIENQFSFCEGFKKKTFHKFTTTELNKITKQWSK
jgi:hypothetical protein